MKRSEIFLMILKVPLDFVMVVLAGISAYYFRFSEWALKIKSVSFGLTLTDFLSILMPVVFLVLLIFAFFGLYSLNQNRKFSAELMKIIFALSVCLAFIALYILFSGKLFDSRFLFLFTYIFSIIYIFFGRLFVRGLKSILYRSGVGLRKVIIIGDDEMTKKMSEILEKRKELGYLVVKKITEFNEKNAKEILSLEVNEIIFAASKKDEKQFLRALNFCNLNHLVFKYSADLFSVYSNNIVMNPLAGVPIIEIKKTPLEAWGRVSKRFFDVIMSIFIIIITSPLMLLVAVLVFFETGRPIIYKNERVGIREKKFFTLKFRSMYQKDSTGIQFGKEGEKALKKEEELIAKNNSKIGPIYKIQNDPRVTKIGKFIRRTSIDELPQFFNVLFGTMSIVGPRPHQPREVDNYKENFPKVFTLKPGITGLSQISGRSDLSFEEEMKLDIFYIENWSLFLDIIIFIKTPFVLFKKRKAL